MERWVVIALAGCGFHGPAELGTAADDAPALVTDGPMRDAGIDDGGPIDALMIDASGFDAAPIPVTFVQGGSTSSTGTSISLALTANERLGDFNVVGVSWATTGVTINSVSDGDGNTYAQITGSPLVLAGSGVLAVYYAANVHQGLAPNMVRVTFSATTSPILMVAEYGGIAAVTPVDVTSTGKAGSGTAATSANVSTTHAHDLLIGVGAAGANMSAGSGYTTRVASGLDLIEDREVTTTGTYAAAATLSSSNGWTIALLAVKSLN